MLQSPCSVRCHSNHLHLAVLAISTQRAIIAVSSAQAIGRNQLVLTSTVATLSVPTG